jgi:hypothetical protein
MSRYECEKLRLENARLKKIIALYVKTTGRLALPAEVKPENSGDDPNGAPKGS